MVRLATTSFVAVALAVASTACNGETTRNARDHVGAPINLTGCLQKGDGMNTFVLTPVNEPTRSVGTSGSTSDPGAVKQEQMREAKHAYRLKGDDRQLESLVGKQVSVEGIVADSSDVNRKANEARKDDKPLDLDSGDLAKVDVKSIAQIGEACSSPGR